MTTITIPDYCEITIRRANGEIETAKPTAAEMASDKAHAEYVAGYNRVAGMSAGGETYDHAR